MSYGTELKRFKNNNASDAANHESGDVIETTPTCSGTGFSRPKRPKPVRERKEYPTTRIETSRPVSELINEKPYLLLPYWAVRELGPASITLAGATAFAKCGQYPLDNLYASDEKIGQFAGYQRAEVNRHLHQLSKISIAVKGERKTLAKKLGYFDQKLFDAKFRTARWNIFDLSQNLKTGKEQKYIEIPCLFLSTIRHFHRRVVFAECINAWKMMQRVADGNNHELHEQYEVEVDPRAIARRTGFQVRTVDRAMDWLAVHDFINGDHYALRLDECYPELLPSNWFGG